MNDFDGRRAWRSTQTGCVLGVHQVGRSGEAHAASSTCAKIVVRAERKGSTISTRPHARARVRLQTAQKRALASSCSLAASKARMCGLLGK